MSVSLVMTIIGADRPGLVELVAARIADHGGNWLGSRMSHLAGQFAGILQVQVAEDQEDALVQSLRQLEAQGLRIVVASDEGETAASRLKLVHLEVIGQDRPGIVRQLSQVLAGRGVNVEELHTDCSSAPMSGEMLFKAEARLLVPSDVSVDDLRGDLERVASDLMVDCSLQMEE